MAIYKSSLHSPNLEEVDLSKSNTFSCMVNTSGEPILAYKMQILSGRGDETIYSPIEPISLSKPIKNKEILKMAEISSNMDNLKGEFENGKNYQWGVRLYNQKPYATTQPNTLVCDGFLVGSTKYITWCQISDQTTSNKKIVDQIVYDRYIEFDTVSAQMIKGAKDDVSKKVPDTLRERRKIDWVTKELGYNKNFVKIETTEDFSFNYIDGTPFKIFQCSDEHTIKSFFVDPNSNINISDYIVLFNSATAAKNAHDIGYKPSLSEISGGADPEDDTIPHTAENMFGPPRKIIGYSSDTGEIRVGQSYVTEPENGYAYLIFEYDSVNKVFNEIEPNIGDDAGSDILNNPYLTQLVGGLGISYDNYKVITNRWDETVQRLFIQPNVNIKMDETNPNEIVFENGARIDIKKQYWMNDGVEVDITFDKLDNTQWLLTTDSNGLNESGEGPSLADESLPLPPIAPQTDYKVYTDFMDSMPFNIFYARTAPKMEIEYRDLNKQEENFQSFEGLAIPLRNIQFNTNFEAVDGQSIKYYHYYLYAYKDYVPQLIAQSEDIYSSELVWDYRGFLSETKYNIRISVIDEYDKEFTHSNDFQIQYSTAKASAPLGVEFDCNKKAIKITASSPEYATPTLPNLIYWDENIVPVEGQIYYKDGEYVVWDGNDYKASYLQPITENNIYIDENELYDDYIEINKDNQLYYDTVLDDNFPNTKIQIPVNFSFLTQFQITSEFIEQIPLTNENQKLKIASIGYEGFNPQMYRMESKEISLVPTEPFKSDCIYYFSEEIVIDGKQYNIGHYIWNEETQTLQSILLTYVNVSNINQTVFTEGAYYLFETDMSYKDMVCQAGYYLWGDGANNEFKSLHLFLNSCQNFKREGEELIKNFKRGYLEIYDKENPAKDDMPLECFVIGKDNEGKEIFSNKLNLLNLDKNIPAPTGYKYAIQSRTLAEPWEYRYANTLDTGPKNNNGKIEKYRIYGLSAADLAKEFKSNADFSLMDKDGNFYGVYIWDDKYEKWVLDSTEYVYINNVSDLKGYGITDSNGKLYDEMELDEQYDYLSVPQDCRGDDGILLWKDSALVEGNVGSNGYIWVDNSAYSYNTLLKTINNIWFSMHLTVTSASINPIRCIIDSQEKWEG